MYCTNCGSKLEDGAAFCVNCGSSVEEEIRGSVGAGISANEGVGERASAGVPAGIGAPAQFAQTTQPLQTVQPIQTAQTINPAQPIQPQASKNSNKSVIIAASIAGAVILIAIVVFACLFAFGGIGGAPSANTTEPPQASESPSSAADSAQNAEDAQEEADDKPEIRGTLEDYSWEEIGDIADMIEDEAKSKSDAVKIAAEYNLCISDGTLFGPEACKTINYGGDSIEVFIIGIFHDTKTNGKRAPFTFMTNEIDGTFPMNSTNTNAGGWAGSLMREELTYKLDEFPRELADEIEPVEKLTNNVGQSRDVSCVSETTDSIWLFSWKECLGNISWNQGVDSSYIDAIDNMEGEQYDWFIQQGVRGNQDAPCLERRSTSGAPSVWWMRSSAPNTSTSFGDMGPAVDNGGLASTPEGVVFGFCI